MRQVHATCDMRHATCAHATCAHARIALVKLFDDLKSGVLFFKCRYGGDNHRHAPPACGRMRMHMQPHACRVCGCMPRVWYGFGRLAHQAVRPPSRRGERPRRRRQAAARGRRDRRQREGQVRVRSCRVFLFTLTQKGRMPCHVASRISHVACRMSHVASRMSHVAVCPLHAARCMLRFIGRRPCMGTRNGVSMNPAAHALVFGFKTTAKKLDRTGNPRMFPHVAHM